MADINSVITERWSPYSFTDRTLEREELLLILEAAKYAPSSYNEQPWRFLHATSDDKKRFNDFLSFLADANKVWAQYVPVLMVVLAKKLVSHTGRDNYYALHDTGMATANMLVQATSMGVSMHIMGGFSHDAVREHLHIGEDLVPVSMIAAGYQGKNEKLAAEYSGRDKARRSRRGLNEYLLNT